MTSRVDKWNTTEDWRRFDKVLHPRIRKLQQVRLLHKLPPPHFPNALAAPALPLSLAFPVAHLLILGAAAVVSRETHKDISGDCVSRFCLNSKRGKNSIWFVY